MDEIREFLKKEATAKFQKESYHGYVDVTSESVHMVNILATLGLILCDIRDELKRTNSIERDKNREAVRG